jgi:hypothetical protein
VGFSHNAPKSGQLEAQQAEQPTPDAALARARAAVRRRRIAECAVVFLLGSLVFAVHDVPYMLSQSFWTDEAWVAVTTRFPLSQLAATTGSTPIGWSLLLRLVTDPGTQISRLLPLAFAGAAVIIAYWLARQLSWRWPPASVAAGLTAGIGVLLVPAMLQRNDLKQYTADACMALLVLALTSRLERQWSLGGLLLLSVAAWGGMLLSDTVVFVGVAAFLAVCVTELARRHWRRLAQAVPVGAGTAILMIVIYVAFYRRAVTPQLTNAPGFIPYYLPWHAGLRADVSFVTSCVAAVRDYFGLGPVWLAVPLVLAGLVTIARLGRPATAVAVAGLWPEMLAVSAAKKYPFLDPRTATFLFAITIVVAAIGLIGVCLLLRPWLHGGIAAGLALAGVLLFAAGAAPYVRSHTIPNENVRDQTLYVAQHSAPSDVILVNMSSNWGFAYYWPVGQPSERPDSVVAQGYVAYFPGQPRIIVAPDRVQAVVSAALARAVKMAQQLSSSRIWLIRSHMSTSEQKAWRAALAQQGLSAKPLADGLEVVPVG